MAGIVSGSPVAWRIDIVCMPGTPSSTKTTGLRAYDQVWTRVYDDAFSPIRYWNLYRGLNIPAAWRVQESVVAECVAIVAFLLNQR